ncbi:bifunctional folylpolyglutamate synthase/dihydrofolate synthase [Terribacillus saccharophilus]|uniref:bifunctional folylpolyglutamate synthase/dihydrofolate synthase n=1 Tax=Terribacillus saccharophilus TaxID=361277 RepID=UPI00298A06AF|nr:folylpolyglutamate synthase/dihydrofolate synthase family protein [Terribacillus saccharophilus]MCM3224335.1 bifunctional folylpolyglutamate synthase/dihydrofolate synthase [Terribacillus saccharophilus]
MFANLAQAEAFLTSRRHLGIKPGLHRVQQLLNASANPERRMKSIHIAGTNGKGSTSTYLAKALTYNGYKSGSFISPTPGGFLESIQVDGKWITEEEFIAECDALLSTIEEMDQQDNHPSEFEIHVSIAFSYLAKHADISVIEAGMGGRGDATNVLQQPLLSIITNIGRDHQRFLGDTIEEIAEEKAGIIKAGAPVISAVTQSGARAVIENQANAAAVPITWIDEKDADRLQINPQMKGSHQKVNAALAAKACHLLQEMGFSIDTDKVKEAISEAQLPGRFELVESTPRIILDGAHNAEGMAAFIETVKQSYPNERIEILFSAFQDKPFAQMIQQLKEITTDITLTTFNHPRAAELKTLSAAFPSVQVVADWQDWMRRIYNDYQTDTVYFVTGSLHFIYQVRKYIVQNRKMW